MNLSGVQSKHHDVKGEKPNNPEHDARQVMLMLAVFELDNRLRDEIRDATGCPGGRVVAVTEQRGRHGHDEIAW